MTLVLSVSHVDLPQALRLMAWIGFLSCKAKNQMLNEKLLIVVSRRASRRGKFKQLCWLASKVFGQARCYVPPDEHECGWPGSANWMFKTALEHVERHFPDDIFFLEPDAIPLTPVWWDVIQAEWVIAQTEGKSFMGAFVPHSPSHMTGNAVYGRNWRRVAPSLATTPDHDAFDTWSAPEVVPNCHFVKIIQHVFRRHDPGWVVPSLGIVDRNAVVFHQDKQGRLISLIDQAQFAGECLEHPLFSYGHLHTEDPVMRKFYYAANVTRPIMAQGKRYQFQALECHGGAIPGVFSTELESEQAALAELTNSPTTGVTEISQEEWENVSKKKAPPPLNTSISKPSNGALPQASLLATPSQSPAVVVVEDSSAPASDGLRTVGGVLQANDISEVIKLDKVEPAQPTNAPEPKYYTANKLPRPDVKPRLNYARNVEAENK